MNEIIKKQVIDMYLDSSKDTYEKMYSTRQSFRDRSITTITIFLGILGAIIALTNDDFGFIVMFKETTIVFKVFYFCFVSLGIISFLLSFIIAKSTRLGSQYERMVDLISIIKKEDKEGKNVKAIEEGLTVNANEYCKIDLIKSYSEVADILEKNILMLKWTFFISLFCIIVSIILSIITII